MFSIKYYDSEAVWVSRTRPGGVIRAGNTEQRPSGLTGRPAGRRQKIMDWECSIFSWEIQYTFVLMGQPLVKLSLSPSGQTICNVKCVRLYYKSPTCSTIRILCKGWPPILSHKDNLFIYKPASACSTEYFVQFLYWLQVFMIIPA